MGQFRNLYKIKEIKTIIMPIMICLFILLHINPAHAAVKNTPSLTIADSNTEYIFVGDSRFVGMNEACNLNNYENIKVIAKIGEGYKWLTDKAEPLIANEIKKSKYQHQKVIIGLGVNDLGNIDRYITEYANLAKNYDIVITSVNPIEHHKNITNNQISDFNVTMQNTGLPFINTAANSSIKFKTTDGLHYTANTYQNIFTDITGGLALLQLVNNPTT